MIGGYKVIALCTARLHDEESNQFIETLNKQAVKEGYRLFVYGVCSDLYWKTQSEYGEAAIYQLIDYDKIDALIVYQERIHSEEIVGELIQKGIEKGIPVISIGKEFPGCVSVRFDYASGFEKVVRHVIEDHKLTDIHYIGGQKGNEFSEERKRVVERVLKENGYTFDPETMVSYGEFWSGPTQEAVEKLIAGGRLPKAVICANDYMAITTCDVLKNHGYRIPEDIVVTGYDGVDEIMFAAPPITSCKCNYSDLAGKVVDVVTKCFAKESMKAVYPVESRMIIAKSCGCMGKEITSASEYIISRNNRFYGLQEMNRSFTERSVKVQMCETLQDTVEYFKCEYISEVFCMINKSCADEMTNPSEYHGEESYEASMLLLFDSEGEDDKIKEVPRDMIAPNMEQLFEKKVPFIFVGLNALNIPLGYLCFHYKEDNISKYDKIPQIVNYINNAMGGYRNMKYQQHLAKQIENMYKTDALTGLYNRIAFLKIYEKMQKEFVREKSRFTVMLADLDRLKYINDTFGHDEGDNAIYIVAKALQNVSPEGSVCVRFGGDEMMAVCKGAYDSDKLQDNLERWLDNYNKQSGKPYEVSASFGIYVTDGEEAPEFQVLLKRTDEIMYRNKEQKRKLKNCAT